MKEDVHELYLEMKSMAKTTTHTMESIWYAPDSMEEKGLVLKDIFADHKITWVSWIVLGTIFIF